MANLYDNQKDTPVYVPSKSEVDCIREVLSSMERMRNVRDQGYQYFNGRSLIEAIDDWTKRWNGYIPPMNPLLDATSSQIFVNFTRNAIISYLSKVAMSPVKAKVVAVNKKTKMPDKKFAEVLKDLKQFSENAENGPARFLEAAIECVTKGTVVVYEGYMRSEQETKIPTDFDSQTGAIKYKKDTRLIYDDCYQKVVPLEDFYIINAYQSDVQKQPKVIWKTLTTHSEAEQEFGHYKNFKFVKPGSYVTGLDSTTFYRENISTDLVNDQVEIMRYYNKLANQHIIMLNGVILYDGPIPFKDGNYPFAKAVNEPFAVDFFWGNGHPGKYMGEQDLINSFVNMMADKTFNSLAITGISSDLDDLIEDDYIQIGKMRKVGNVEAWKWWEAPPVNSGEQNMFQNVLNLARENSGSTAGNNTTPRGGKLTARQILLQQQEVIQKMSFSMNFLEDLERDRSILRINHILQFYSIPKIEKITGKRGKEIEQMIYRDVQLSGVKLSDGKRGNKVIKLIGNEYQDPNERAKIADQLSVTEAMGEETGTPTEALAVSVDTFYDYNLMVQVVKNSSFEQNQALDQAMRGEYLQMRTQLAQLGVPTDFTAISNWIDEAWDVDSDQFIPQGGQAPPMGQPAQPGQPQPGASPLVNQLGNQQMKDSVSNFI